MADNIAITAAGTTISTKDRGAIGHEQVVLQGLLQTRTQITPTITTTPYTSGDAVGGIMQIANAARYAGGSGLLESVLLLDRSQAQRAAIDLFFFDRSVTVAGENNPITMSDADMVFFLGMVSIVAGSYNAVFPGTPLNSVAEVRGVNMPYILNGTDLFCQAVVRATPTYAVGDLTFTFTLAQD